MWNNLSAAYKNKPPNASGSNRNHKPRCDSLFMPSQWLELKVGDQKLAAIITPDANPKIKLKIFRYMFKENTVDAPIAVTKHVKERSN